MLRDKFLQIMTIALSAYTSDHLRDYVSSVKKTGIREHGFPRLTANMGLLLANGCLDKSTHDEYLPLFREMMDFCCYGMANRHCANDFSVKEICFAWQAVRDAELFSPELLDYWRAGLASMDCWRDYDCIAPTPDTPVGNWAAYGAASEWMRHMVTGCDCGDFQNRQLPSQLLSVDECGMYRDPNNPMLYDLATRAQFAVLLHQGYDGPYRAALDDCLCKAGLLTLRMQSVTGEIPFGGRSNQYLFNEAYLAAVCAYEARRYHKEGNPSLAGQFQDAAALAADSILAWLTRLDGKRHVKNRFPMDSSYGCEGYGYFDKYMISLASFIYLAVLFVEESIVPVPCPARIGGFTARTSEHFHKLFASCGGYFLEWDTDADPHYDGTGLGRIHKCGVPSPLVLSVPFSKSPVYALDCPGFKNQENPGALSFCGGVLTESGWLWSAEAGAMREAVVVTESAELVEVAIGNSLGQRELYRIAADGVEITLTGQGMLAYAVPLFVQDGKISSTIALSGGEAVVVWEGAQLHVTTPDTLTDTGMLYRNRNGVYRLHTISGENTVKLRLWCK